jgi:hypothetical protein
MLEIVRIAMRVIGLDRLPLPDLKIYAGLSAVLLVCSVFYAVDTTAKNPDWRANFTEPWHMATYVSDYVEAIPWMSVPETVCIKDVLLFMVTDLRCIWVSSKRSYYSKHEDGSSFCVLSLFVGISWCQSTDIESLSQKNLKADPGDYLEVTEGVVGDHFEFQLQLALNLFLVAP